MTDTQTRYRFRGNVDPKNVKPRPAAAYRNAASGGSGSGASASSATLDIFDVIDSYGGWWGISAGDVDTALKQIGDVETLYVRINSPGGEATEGVAIANLLRAHPADVRVTVYGIAASAASYISTAGDHVSMAPGSLMFIHDAWEIALGDAADLRKVADTLDVISDSIAGLYVLKAGGTTATWRAAMHEDTWYSAESAVTAKLADVVGIDPMLPADLPPVVAEDDEDDDTTTIEIDIELSPAARAAARQFDLSMVRGAAAALAPKTPAEPPVTPTTDHKEADTMSDTLSKGLRERLGVAEDADEGTILAALDEALTEQVEPTRTETGKPDLKAAQAALEAEGMTVVPQAFLDSLKDGAEAGKAALARQRREDRDAAIVKAQTAGKLSRAKDEVDKWSATYDRDPEGTAKWLDDLPVRFPVGPTNGFTGSESQKVDEHGHVVEESDTTVWSREEADALGAQAGLPKGALI